MALDVLMHAQLPKIMRAATLMVGAIELPKTEETINVPPVLVAAVGEIGVVNRQSHAVIIKELCF